MIKAMPLMIMAAGVTANADKIQKLLDYTTNVAVQAEVNEISKLIVLDSVVESHLPRPENFSAFLRANLRVNESKGQKRDVTADQWGNPYQLEYQDRDVIVSSAGQDGEYGTDDDVYSRRRLD